MAAPKANSSWPNDAKILTGVLMRVDRLGQKPHVFGLEDLRQGWVPRRLEEMDNLDFQKPAPLKVFSVQGFRVQEIEAEKRQK